MTDILKTASDWLNTQNAAHRAISVTYRRSSTTAIVAAVIGRTKFRVSHEYGQFETYDSRDYLIAISALSAFDEPESGDEIIETIDGVDKVFEVMAPADEPLFRYADPYRQIFRIHTKFVGADS